MRSRQKYWDTPLLFPLAAFATAALGVFLVIEVVFWLWR
jgi:hypothetical protein